MNVRLSQILDLVTALAVLLVVVMMVVPLPTWLLSLLLVANLGISLALVLNTVYAREPLALSTFPSLVLLLTLFRLALNVSSTRLILSNADAGPVIAAFGNFVVGGNAVVGFVVFLIIVVIQFVVITRGAERVAEVAARFTLDAMPGKQMSIDAELNAGSISDAEARQRRREIEREADFYGAMDGASKFVKGDAVAGLVIIAVNLLGGFIIGMVQRGMSFQTALSTYSLLTVGDGLVTQIPALLVSTAAGIVVTRAASDTGLGQEVVRQTFSQPRVLYVTAAVLALFGVVPALPGTVFFALAAGFALLGYASSRSVDLVPAEPAAAAGATAAARPSGAAGERGERQPESVLPLLGLDPLELELGYGLLALADAQQGGDLLDRIAAIRRQMALELGIVLPYVRIRDNMQLKAQSYVVKLRGIDVAAGEVMPDRLLAMNPAGAAEDLPGIPTREPAFGLDALWIRVEDRDRAELAGWTVVDPSAVMATHLTEVIRAHAHELLGRQEMQQLLDGLRTSHQALLDDVVPKTVSLGEVHRVCQNLLREGLSIRDLVTVLEAIADQARFGKDVEGLTEAARRALARQITRQLAPDGRARVLTLDPATERDLLDALEVSEAGSRLALDPMRAEALLRALSEEIQQANRAGVQPIVFVAPALRPALKRLVARLAPRLVVLSYQELDAGVTIEPIGVVKS